MKNLNNYFLEITKHLTEINNTTVDQVYNQLKEYLKKHYRVPTSIEKEIVNPPYKTYNKYKPREPFIQWRITITLSYKQYKLITYLGLNSNSLVHYISQRYNNSNRVTKQIYSGGQIIPHK